MFFVGLIVGIGIGAVWMVGARIVVKMRQDNIVGTPSASHNKKRNAIFHHNLPDNLDDFMREEEAYNFHSNCGDR